MVKELWNTFPRLIEQKINALLDTAMPNQHRAFLLYKTCQNENLLNGSFEKFSASLEKFFTMPRTDRHKSDFDHFLDRPMDMNTYGLFHLNFHNAHVSERAVTNIASWAHNLIRINVKTDCSIVSTDVLNKTLHYITNPPGFEKAQDIEFDDFCTAWKKTVFKLFGKIYDPEMGKILSELKWLNTQNKESEKNGRENGFVPTIYLTQTEIDWTTSVLKSITEDRLIPKFPLSRGPQKQRLIDLERAVSLYKIVQTTRLPELIKHRDNIRATILNRCETLLRERAR